MTRPKKKTIGTTRHRAGSAYRPPNEQYCAAQANNSDDAPGDIARALLRDLEQISRIPARTGTPHPLPDELDALAPLFDSRDFTVDDAGDTRSETIWKMNALVLNLDLWAGTGAELDDMARFPPAPERFWWPRPPTGAPAHDARCPIVRVGMGHHPGLVGFEDRWLYVAVDWPSGSAVRRLIGSFGPVAAAMRRAEALQRAMAISAMARAEGLPTEVPRWVLSRVDARDPDNQTATLFESTAFDRGTGDALDYLAWDDLRSELAPFDLADKRFYPQVSLIWRWSADEVVGANIQQLAELLAPAFVLARMAMEETLRPFGRPHPVIRALRSGFNLLNEMEDYPPGWHTNPGDPVEVIERDLIRTGIGRRIEGLPERRADILLAHAVEWRRLPGIGLAGVIQMFDALG